MGEKVMGMNAKFISLLRHYQPKGLGASFGYPEIKKMHGLNLQDLLNQLQMKIDIYDIKQFFGNEIIFDLNKPIPETLFQKYDYIINPGTYEHCFNITQAMLNGYNMVKAGGISFHTGPIGRQKHGFWNFTIDTFADFYKINGGKLLYFSVFNESIFVVAQNGNGNLPAAMPYEKR